MKPTAEGTVLWPRARAVWVLVLTAAGRSQAGFSSRGHRAADTLVSDVRPPGPREVYFKAQRLW